jgi:hypothetical protein
MLIHKIDVAKLQLDTAINLFLDDIDFISSLTLAGASEEISGKLLERVGKDSMLKKLHAWYKDTLGEEIKYDEFAKKANLARNCLKHSHVKEEDTLEIYKWEAVQMIMRAMINYKELAGVPSEPMNKMAGWIEVNKDIYSTIK